jgi:hypothetical protein
MKPSNRIYTFTLLVIALCSWATIIPAEAQSAATATTVRPMDRTVLPIPEPKPPIHTEIDASKATPPPRFEVKAPDGTPNVLIVLIDDLGFGGTSAFGKWHETAAWEASIAGPFDRWPTRQGFDKFYGFLGGETNHWAPFIYDGVQEKVEGMLNSIDKWGGPETYPTWPRAGP